MQLADNNNRLAFLTKEGKLKDQSSNGKNSYFIINNNPYTSHESVSKTDNATSTTTTCPCTNDLNAMKERISVLNTETTAMQSFMLEQMVIFRKSAPPILDTPNKIPNIFTYF